jgi:type I restriction enzyme, R subunit
MTDNYQNERLSETDTMHKLINPAIYASGWTEAHIRRETSAGKLEGMGKKKQRKKGRVDMLLRVMVNSQTQPVAVALIEAKKNTLPPTHGIEQGKLYSDSERFKVPFVFSSNGYMFVEYDRSTGQTSQPRPISEFPTPDDLRARYEKYKGFNLEDPAAKPLLVPYQGGEGARRYYQDAAIRATFEKLAQDSVNGRPGRALLALATGAGKTFIATQLLRRIADAGQLKRALFVCDRDELRSQAIGALSSVFGANAAEVKRKSDGSNNAANAAVHVATYQTLGVSYDDDDATFLTEHYPENHFSHIIIDECHRSAWGKWSEVLRRNPNAVQIGLTATPRALEVSERTAEFLADMEMTADNIKHFGEPVYSYDLTQGIEDGYLAACEVIQDLATIDETGITLEEIIARGATNSITGQTMSPNELRAFYDKNSFEAKIILPDRVQAMCEDFFKHLLETGGPHQKTVIFCARDSHADAVARTLEGIYAKWCEDNDQERAEYYAFKCTAENDGGDYLADLRGSSRTHFVATTVDLLSTGVDVPRLENIVFFKYVNSPISFYQMVGRGTRIDEASGKVMFRVYDYTDASRLFGEKFLTRFSVPKEQLGKYPKAQDETDTDTTKTIEPPPGTGAAPIVKGFTVQVTSIGRFVLASRDGAETLVPLEEYRQQLSEELKQNSPNLTAFRSIWVRPDDRRTLINQLVYKGLSPHVIQYLDDMREFDLYDVLADLTYGMNPLTRETRAHLFDYKHTTWLEDMPRRARLTVKALVKQFARSGTEGLEKTEVFDMPDVIRAGGVKALLEIGKPFDVLVETKERVFTA